MNVCEATEVEPPIRSTITIRKARDDDVPALITLHRVALRELGRSAYNDDQIDSWLLHVPTLDDALIDDGTYFVAEADGRVVGAGGWSARGSGYSDAVEPDDGMDRDVAMIRDMYTHPDWTRQGIGRRILASAETEARNAGFRRIELHALLPGVPLYRACGYQPVERCVARLPDGESVPILRMRKRPAAA